MDNPDDTREARLQTMIRALQEAFGETALEVARRQVELADGETSVVWRRIVAGLGG